MCRSDIFVCVLFLSEVEAIRERARCGQMVHGKVLQARHRGRSTTVWHFVGDAQELITLVMKESSSEWVVRCRLKVVISGVNAIGMMSLVTGRMCNSKLKIW